MRRFRLPIRLKLTLWYTAILAVSLALAGAAVFVLVRRGLFETLEESLENRASLLAGIVTLDASGAPNVDLDPDDDSLEDSFLRYFDASGNVVADNSEQFDEVSLQPGPVERALRGRRTFNTEYELDDFEEVRVFTMPLREGRNIVGVLQVGESMEEINETTSTMLLVFAIAAPAALAASGLGGWWLSGRALAPVNRVTSLAREISGGDLSRRLNLDLPNDELGRLATTFDEMIEKLDYLVQQQRQFTADASHELRTPLSAIRGQVDVALQRERSPEEYRTTLQTIDRQLARMTKLVEDLLLVARSEAGKLQLQKERLRVDQLVEAIQEQMQPLAEAKGLSFSVEAGPQTYVQGDEALLLQLLLNLVDNAVRYTETGSVAIGWRQAGERVEVYVRDTGPGVAPEERERIFEPFYRGDSARSYAGGSGLGLSISRWIAVAHEGSLTVSDHPEGGAVFTLSLPRSIAPDPRFVH